MGAWGPGLYSSDVALDLKPLIATLARLPVADGEILGMIKAQYPGVADDPTDEDHSSFWLVLADQFVKRGIDCPATRARALEVIDAGLDITMLEALEMGAADLRKRRAMLAALRPVIAQPPAPAKPRATLKKPQPYLMEIGDCYIYPTSKGEGINAYYPSKDVDKSWRQDGWGAAVLCERGRAFGYLAWYRLCAVDPGYTDKPTLDDVRAARFGAGLSAGTCSPVHFKRMELEKIGELPVDPEAIHRLVPELRTDVRSGDKAAILDVSLCNNLAAGQGRFRGPAVAEVLAG